MTDKTIVITHYDMTHHSYIGVRRRFLESKGLVFKTDAPLHDPPYNALVGNWRVDYDDMNCCFVFEQDAEPAK